MKFSGLILTGWLCALLGAAVSSQRDDVSSDICGTPKRDFVLESQVTLIYNGHTSIPGDFPWAAALYLKNRSGLWDQACGGTLISNNSVLTAAHCVVQPNGKDISAQDLIIKLGQVSRDFYTNETNAFVSTVKSIIRGPRYVGIVHNYAHDIAILELQYTVPISDYIKPVCLDLSGGFHLTDGDTLFISGWGANNDSVASPVMQWTTQTYLEYDKCLSQVDDIRFITLDKFCVDNTGDTGADKGDSGGGVTQVRDGVHYLMGVISTRLITTKKIMASTNLTDLNLNHWLVHEYYRLRNASLNVSDTAQVSVATSHRVGELMAEQNTITPPALRKSYKIRTEKVSWRAAVKRCKEENMTLASIRSVEEHTEFNNTVSRQGITGNSRRIWLGAADLDRQAYDIVWVGDNSRLNYTNWGENEPRGCEKKLCHCVRTAPDLTWYLMTCRNEEAYACEYYN